MEEMLALIFSHAKPFEIGGEFGKVTVNSTALTDKWVEKKVKL